MMAATESISEMQTQAIKKFIGKWPESGCFKGIVKKNVALFEHFFSTIPYTAFPLFRKLLWKTVKN